MRVQKKTKKPLIITVTVVLAVIIASLVWYFIFANQSSDDTVQEDMFKTSSNKEIDSGSDRDSMSSSQTIDSNQSVTHEDEKNNLPQLYEGENANTQPSLTGAITSRSVTNGTLVIRNTIDQLVSGTCSLALTSGDKTVTRSTEIIQNPSSSSCSGFDIPVSELSPGQWTINIRITSGGKSMNLTDKVDI